MEYTARRESLVPRRNVLKGAAASAVAVALPLIRRRADAQAKRIVVRDPGGPYTIAAENFYKPFREATGIEVVRVTSAPEPVSQIKAMVDTKTYAWDMAVISPAAADRLMREGGYLENHGLDKHPDVSEIPEAFRSPYLVGNDVYATVLAYRTDAFRGRKAPASWKELWDVNGFPGRRALFKHPYDTIEEALLADGVPKEQLYPCDLDRAFRSLDRIRKHVAVWWTGGAQASQLLKTGEVDICPTWNGRAQAAVDDGAPVAIEWEQNLWGWAGWAILKGGPNVDLCRELIKFAANAKRQAAYIPHMGYGTTNPNAYKYIDPKRARLLPSFPDNHARGIGVDYRYWVANTDKVLERFNAWLVS